MITCLKVAPLSRETISSQESHPKVGAGAAPSPLPLLFADYGQLIGPISIVSLVSSPWQVQ